MLENFETDDNYSSNEALENNSAISPDTFGKPEKNSEKRPPEQKALVEAWQNARKLLSNQQKYLSSELNQQDIELVSKTETWKKYLETGRKSAPFEKQAEADLIAIRSAYAEAFPEFDFNQKQPRIKEDSFYENVIHKAALTENLSETQISHEVERIEQAALPDDKTELTEASLQNPVAVAEKQLKPEQIAEYHRTLAQTSIARNTVIQRAKVILYRTDQEIGQMRKIEQQAYQLNLQALSIEEKKNLNATYLANVALIRLQGQSQGLTEEDIVEKINAYAYQTFKQEYEAYYQQLAAYENTLKQQNQNQTLAETSPNQQNSFENTQTTKQNLEKTIEPLNIYLDTDEEKSNSTEISGTLRHPDFAIDIKINPGKITLSGKNFSEQESEISIETKNKKPSDLKNELIAAIQDKLLADTIREVEFQKKIKISKHFKNLKEAYTKPLLKIILGDKIEFDSRKKNTLKKTILFLNSNTPQPTIKRLLTSKNPSELEDMIDSATV